MTPEQYLSAQMAILIANALANNANGTSNLCDIMGNFINDTVLPNLTVDLNTGLITFNVPPGN